MQTIINSTLVSGSSYLPLTLSETNPYIRQIDGTDTALVNLLISASYGRLRHDLGYAPCPSIMETTLTGSFTAGKLYRFAYGNVPGLVSVTNATGTAVDTASFSIRKQYGANYLYVNTDVSDTLLHVRYNNGWDSGSFPTDLKLAMLSSIATKYDFRGDGIPASFNDISTTYYSLIQKYVPQTI